MGSVPPFPVHPSAILFVLCLQSTQRRSELWLCRYLTKPAKVIPSDHPDPRTGPWVSTLLVSSCLSGKIAVEAARPTQALSVPSGQCRL